ncbi:MAG: DUF2306 domain-containing protein [Actinomycetales bacterium]
MTTTLRAGLSTLLILGCLLIGGVGLYLVATGFTFVAPTVQLNALPLAVRVHVLSGSIALLLVPWQVLPRVRRHHRLHRWIGRGYVVAAVIAGSSGLLAAFGTANGAVAGAGFALAAVLWTWSSLAAATAARGRRIRAHQVWAIRSLALCLAAVTLRVYLGAAQGFGIPLDFAYPAVAWLSWVPNLLIAQWWVSTTRSRARQSNAAVAR